MGKAVVALDTFIESETAMLRRPIPCWVSQGPINEAICSPVVPREVDTTAKLRRVRRLTEGLALANAVGVEFFDEPGAIASMQFVALADAGVELAETIVADTAQALTAAEMAALLHRISKPVAVESVELSADPDESLLL